MRIIRIVVQRGEEVSKREFESLLSLFKADYYIAENDNGPNEFLDVRVPNRYAQKCLRVLKGLPWAVKAFFPVPDVDNRRES